MADKNFKNSQPPTMRPDLLTVADAAAYIGVSPRFIYTLVHSGRLSSTRPFGSRRVLVPRCELDDALADGWRPAWRR